MDNLIAEIEASGVAREELAAGAGMSPARLSAILAREQVPTVPEYLALRKALGHEAEFSEEVAADLERLRVAMQGGGELGEILDELLGKL